MSECIFCKIVAGKIPSKRAYEDEECFAFHDINPQAPVHILLVPRRHLPSVHDAGTSDGALLGHLLLKARQLAQDLKLVDGGYRLVINTGENAGQTVFHLHVHLLAGRTMGWPPG